MKKLIIITLAAAIGFASTAGCDLDVGDLNNPGIDNLIDNPTPSVVSAALTGLVIGSRRNQAAANGYVVQLGILGREAYNFDQADPRFIGELLQGVLNPGSPFGGNFWTGPYANIRLANTIVKAVDKVPEFEAEERAAIKGFAATMIAADLLEIIATRDEIGAVIDTDRDLDEPLGPIVDRAMVYAEIVSKLDQGATDLAAAGAGEFPFALSTGYAGFDTPANFLKFNRALRARAAAYTEDHAGVLAALGASFLNTTVTNQAGLDVGVYYSYSTGAGDAVNNLINPNIFAHPSLVTDVQKNGTTNDLRLTRKTKASAMGGSGQGLTSNVAFTLYPGPDSPVPYVRNEELILLRAEALFFTGDEPGALAALNIVRTISGGLTAVSGDLDETAFVDALLYERRYSLMFEGGHRWIDQRRFGRDLALDKADHTRNIRFPLPQSECNARPGEARCTMGSL